MATKETTDPYKWCNACRIDPRTGCRHPLGAHYCPLRAHPDVRRGQALAMLIVDRMLDAGYEAAREAMPLDLRPPHGPITPTLLLKMVRASYRAMEAERAK